MMVLSWLLQVPAKARDTAPAEPAKAMAFRGCRLLVKPNPGVRLEQIARFHANNHCEVIALFPGLGGLQILRVPQKEPVLDLVWKYRSSALVAYAEPDYLVRVASAFPEIRLIIGGHNHEVLGPIWLDTTLIAKTGVATHNVGRVDLEFQNKKLTLMEARLIPVKNVRPDPDVARKLETFNVKVKMKMAEVIGEAAADLNYSRNLESPLADMVADAFREKGKTQIAIHNIGGIRAKIAKGKVTWGNAFEVLPFGDHLRNLVQQTDAQELLLQGRLRAASLGDFGPQVFGPFLDALFQFVMCLL